MSFKKALKTPAKKNMQALAKLVDSGAGVDTPPPPPASMASPTPTSTSPSTIAPTATTGQSDHALTTTAEVPVATPPKPAAKPSGQRRATPPARAQAEEPEEIVRVSMAMSADLHAQLKVYSATKRVKLGAMCTQWLEERLQKEQSRDAKAAG